MFRFRVLPVTMPPLCQRDDDSVVLALHFLRSYATQYRRPARNFTPGAIAQIRRYSWPGNVRELENLVLRQVLLTDGDMIDLPSLNAAPPRMEEDIDLDQAFKRAKALAVAQFERNYLKRLLTRSSGNVSLAARLSRKDRGALNRLVKKYGLAKEDFRQSPP
jgi:DNA-binding NtrC family response regulator